MSCGLHEFQWEITSIVDLKFTFLVQNDRQLRGRTMVFQMTHFSHQVLWGGGWFSMEIAVNDRFVSENMDDSSNHNFFKVCFTSHFHLLTSFRVKC
jgi:hypothetical protein